MANFSSRGLNIGAIVLFCFFIGCVSQEESNSGNGQDITLSGTTDILSKGSNLNASSEVQVKSTTGTSSKTETLQEQKPPNTVSQNLPIPKSVFVPEIKDELDPDSSNSVLLKTDVPNKRSTHDEDLSISMHDIWDNLLQTYVDKDGKVNYKGFIRDSAQLNKYLNLLTQSQLDALTRNDKIAFWINAYNAFTVKLIIQNYPVKSIMDLGNGKIWDRKWIKLNHQTLSLNDIEHNVLFKQYPDARFHFALVCAARSCPPLLNRAWEAHTLENDLQIRTQLFIQNPTFNQISKNNISLSKLFEWYGSDFGDIITFLNKFQTATVSEDALITFNEYDWDLNER